MAEEVDVVVKVPPKVAEAVELPSQIRTKLERFVQLFTIDVVPVIFIEPKFAR